jgi:hypothetical protein
MIRVCVCVFDMHVMHMLSVTQVISPGIRAILPERDIFNRVNISNQ